MNLRHLPSSQMTPVCFGPCAASPITMQNPRSGSLCGSCASLLTVITEQEYQGQAGMLVGTAGIKVCSRELLLAMCVQSLLSPAEMVIIIRLTYREQYNCDDTAVFR